jgi:hypothetical protein
MTQNESSLHSFVALKTGEEKGKVHVSNMPARNDLYSAMKRYNSPQHRFHTGNRSKYNYINVKIEQGQLSARQLNANKTPIAVVV